MPSAAHVRLQIEANLARKAPSAFTPMARTVRALEPTGIECVDAVLGGGIPVGGITEIAGGLCSGRTTLAMALLAQMTNTGRVTAWVDVEDSFSPESAAANGVDLERVLWVRCSARAPKGRVIAAHELQAGRVAAFGIRKPWARLEQAMQVVDLVLQGGGFSLIVLDMGGVAPEFARRIPLATWFRWRGAADRAQACLVVLDQMGCAGTSAELVLETTAAEGSQRYSTVMRGAAYRVAVAKRRFETQPEKVVSIRKPPQRESRWDSSAPWIGDATGTAGNGAASPPNRVSPTWPKER